MLPKVREIAASFQQQIFVYAAGQAVQLIGINLEVLDWDRSASALNKRDKDENNPLLSAADLILKPLRRTFNTILFLELRHNRVFAPFTVCVCRVSI